MWSALAVVFTSVILGSNVLLAEGTRITRPCSPCDVDCIRQWFASKCSCNPDVNEAKVDPLFVRSFIAPIPLFNFTVEKTDMTFTGMNKTVVLDMYEDHVADLAVLTMQHSFVIDGWAHIYFHKTNRADFSASTQFHFIFTDFITTSKFYGLDGFRIDDAEVFFESPVEPQIIFGRGSYDALTDERSAPGVKAVMANLPVLYAGESVPISKVSALGYIKTKFCTPHEDFPAYVGIDF